MYQRLLLVLIVGGAFGSLPYGSFDNQNLDGNQQIGTRFVVRNALQPPQQIISDQSLESFGSTNNGGVLSQATLPNLGPNFGIPLQGFNPQVNFAGNPSSGAAVSAGSALISGFQDQTLPTQQGQIGLADSSNQLLNVQTNQVTSQGSLSTFQQPITGPLGQSGSQSGTISNAINFASNQNAGLPNVNQNDQLNILSGGTPSRPGLRGHGNAGIVTSTVFITATRTLTVTETSDYITEIPFLQLTTLIQRLPSREYTSGTPETRTILVTRTFKRIEVTTLTSNVLQPVTVRALAPSLQLQTSTKTFVFSLTHIHTTFTTSRRYTYTTQTLRPKPTETVTKTATVVTTFYTRHIPPVGVYH